MASLFKENVSLTELPIHFSCGNSKFVMRDSDSPTNGFVAFGFENAKGKAWAYWKACELLTTEYESVISMESTLPGKVRLIDTYDGTVYELPDKMIKDDGDSRSFIDLPVRDYPLLLTFGDFAGIDSETT